MSVSRQRGRIYPGAKVRHQEVAETAEALDWVARRLQWERLLQRVRDQQDA